MSVRFRVPLWLPEVFLAILALFFALRELGTFPAAWADDSLFMLVARSVAEGRGYVLPILGVDWHFPYILAVGPPLIWPVALAIRIFGFSVEAARIPQVLYLLGTCVLLYLFTLRAAGRTSARFAALLLITLSAFVNTGKPVLGEVPGFFFLLLGLFVLYREEVRFRHAFLAGLFFGLAILAKLTYGIVLPALLIAWFVFLLQRDWPKVRFFTIAGLVGFLVYLPWRFLEMGSAPGLSGEFRFLIGEGAGQDDILFLARILRGELVFLRPPLLLYGFLFLLGGIGLWQLRKKLPVHLTIVLAFLITLFTLYFVGSFGWYRHLLPAHVLLLPFVTVGAVSLFGKRIGLSILCVIALFQGLWQFDHRGSSGSTEAIDAAAHIEERYADRDLIVQAQEVFIRLPENSHWVYLTTAKISARIKERAELSREQQCMPILRKLSGEEIERYGETWERAGGRYYIIPPPPDCKSNP